MKNTVFLKNLELWVKTMMKEEKVYHSEIVQKISERFFLIKKSLSLSKSKQSFLEEEFFRKTIVLKVLEGEDEPSYGLINNLEIKGEKIEIKIPYWAFYVEEGVSVLPCFLTAITYLITLHILGLFNVVSHRKNGSVFNTLAWFFGAELEKHVDIREEWLKTHREVCKYEPVIHELKYYYEREGIELLRKIGAINNKILSFKDIIREMREDEYLDALFLYQEKVVHTKKLSKSARLLLKLILETGTTSVKEFARALKVSKARASEILQELESKLWIRQTTRKSAGDFGHSMATVLIEPIVDQKKSKDAFISISNFLQNIPFTYSIFLIWGGTETKKRSSFALLASILFPTTMTQNYLKYLKDNIERTGIGTLKFFKILKEYAEYIDLNRVFDEKATLKKEIRETGPKIKDDRETSLKIKDENLEIFQYSMRPKHIKHPREIKKEDLLLNELLENYPVRKITVKKIMETLNVSRPQAEKYLEWIKKAQSGEEAGIYKFIRIWHHPFTSRYFVFLKGIDDTSKDAIKRILEPNIYVYMNIYTDNSALLLILEKDDGIGRIDEYLENLTEKFEKIKIEGIFKEIFLIYTNKKIMHEIAETYDGKTFQVKLKNDAIKNHETSFLL